MRAMPGYIPTDRDDLLARIAREWDGLTAVVSSVPLDRLAEKPTGSEWAIKDYLAHVATWLRVTLARIEHAPEHTIFGLDPVTHRASNVDALNHAAYQLHRDRTAAAVLDDLRDLHAQVVAAAGRLTPAEYSRPTWPDRPHRGPLIENIHHNVADHYRQHAADIRGMLDKAQSGYGHRRAG
jgi:hypothetical protein